MPKPKSDLPTVIIHWALLVTLITSFATGMQIAADTPSSYLAQTVRGLLPQGNVILWHLISAFVFIAIVAAYIAFLWRAGLIARIALNKRWWSMLTGNVPRRTRLRAINTLIYWVGFVALIVAGITGIMLHLVPGLMGYAFVSVIHHYAAWVLPAYIALHVIVLAIMGGIDYLMKLFRPRLAYGVAASVSLVAGAAAAASLFGLERMATGDSLEVLRADIIPELDGKSDDSVWSFADGVTVHTSRGVNHPDGEVSVKIQAVHDGEYFYGLIQWPDSTRSQKHLPLVKTATGWEVQQSEFGIQDEDDYYEDKFGVMLSDQGQIAGNHSIHLGKKPLDGKPGPSGGRGLHYTTDGSIVDVWHWKSVRTGNGIMNQIDDNHFGPPLKPKEGKRYTGGYTKDPKPKGGGGYELNWEKFSDDGVVPKYLPANPAMLEPFQSVDLTPTVGDEMALYLNKADLVPYDPALDTQDAYPVGTIMPAVVVERPMEGDRGDVTSVSKWKDGIWTMEVKRKLNTGSKYDIAFSSERPTYLWVAAFDHAQTRHSRHLHPVSVVLKGGMSRSFAKLPERETPKEEESQRAEEKAPTPAPAPAPAPSVSLTSTNNGAAANAPVREVDGKDRERELERQLGRKTLEVEVMKEALKQMQAPRSNLSETSLTPRDISQ